jgi:hypothetical protein
MSLSLDEFWNLAERSLIFEPGELASLRPRFADEVAVSQGVGSRAAAEWLVNQHKLTVYQAKTLLQGQHGPFQMGEYRILQPRLVPGEASSRWKGVHVGTHHRVLLHIFPEDADERWPFAQECAERARRIRHPNLDRVYTTAVMTGCRMAISEWPEGRSFQELLRRRIRFPSPQACWWVQQMASGLAHLHALGIVHGRLSSEEAVVQTGGHVKLLRALWSESGSDPIDPIRPKSRDACYYLAPEFQQPGTLADALTDVYALGCVLYQLVTGQMPFTSSSTKQIMADHATRRIEPLEQFAAVPAGLTELVSFMMAKRRELRIPDMTEVVDKLNAFVPHGVRQTAPRARTTESYYLAHLQQTEAPQWPRPVAAVDAAAATDATDIAADDVAVDDEPRVVVSVEPKTSLAGGGSARGGRGQWRGWRWPVAGATMLSLTLAVFAFVAARTGTQTEPRREPLAVTSATTDTNRNTIGSMDPQSSGEPPTPSPERPRVMLVDDDGRTPWVSPTAGSPIDLRYMPADSQMFLHARPAMLAAAPEGMAIIQALGPEFAGLQTRLENQWGLPLTDIQQLLVGFQPQDAGPPLVTYRLQLATELRHRVLSASPPPQRTVGGQVVLRDGSATYFPDSVPDVMVVGPPPWIETIAALDADAILVAPLRRQLELLRRASDGDRHVSVLVAPNFLAADGRALWLGPHERLREPLLELLGDATQAASMSLHSGDGTYIELCLVGSAEVPPLTVAAEGRQRLQQLPEQVTRYLEQLPSEQYWQPLALRFPRMLHFLTQQIRTEADDSTAVLNAIVPPGAAHNLILASQLALASTPSRPEEDGGESSRRGIDASLTEPMGLWFEQPSLDMVLEGPTEAVREQTGNQALSTRNAGSDLETVGITQNQQIRFLQLTLQTLLRRSLAGLAMGANPVAVADPPKAKLRLDWVISPDEPATILITTRTAAREKEDSLPEEIVAGETPSRLE